MKDVVERRPDQRSVQIRIESVSRVRRLPDSWSPADLRRLLEVLEIDDAADVADADLAEMAAMGLQDLGADAAAHCVLSHFTDGRFRAGQVQNLCAELREDRAWEEYPDIRHHRALYLCIDVLSEAFPYDFPRPSATCMTLTLVMPHIRELHAGAPLDAATLVRTLACIQPDPAILRRFFASQITRGPFPEAASVIWHLAVDAVDGDTLGVRLHGSSYWFTGIDDDQSATCRLMWPEHQAPG